MTTLLIIFILAALAVLRLRYPQASLLVVTAAIPLYVVRLDLFGLPTNLWELMVGLIVVLSLREVAASARRFHPSPLVILSIALISLGLIFGWWMAADRLEALGIIKGWFIVPALYAYCLWLLTKSNDVKNHILALLVSTLPLSMAALWQVATGDFITIDGRASAWFVSANYLALYLVPILLCGLTLLVAAERTKRLIASVVILLGLGALYFSFSFGGWGAFGLGLLAFVVAYRGHYVKVALPAAAALGFVWYLAYAYVPRFSALFNLSQRTSATVRLEVWQTAWLMAKEKWLAGQGLGSFDQNYLVYAKKIFANPIETMMLHPHNLFLQLMISLGLPGFIGFLLVVIQWWHQLLRITDKALVAGLAAAMTGILIHGLVDTSYFKNDLSAVFWVLLAFTYVASKHTTKTVPHRH